MAVRAVVDYGLARRCLKRDRSDRDEVQWCKGHDYVTLVYQIDEGRRRLLHIAKKRPPVKSLLKFFHQVGPEVFSQIKYVCSDMWRPYLKVIERKLPQALHVLDCFHIVANLGKAINEIRAAEVRKLKEEGFGEYLTRIIAF